MAAVASTLDANRTCQEEELDALDAIFGDALTTGRDLPRTCSLRLYGHSQPQLEVLLRVTMPAGYPLHSPPVYELSAPFLRGPDKAGLARRLDTIYADSFIGEPGVVFAWAEGIQDFIDAWSDKEAVPHIPPPGRDAGSNEQELPPGGRHLPEAGSPCSPEIVSCSSCIEDRKSVFQGHCAQVHKLCDVKAVLERLLENRKIANATHNMYAFRIHIDGKGLLQDSNDDGETQAGGRMLHLLQILDVTNVLVVVSRWYGGVQLGPDRFKHINNATRAVLEQAGLIAKKEHKTRRTRKP